MLNAGAEYAWLDVLCLRQAGGRREDLRAEEWKVDVPTIGRVYRDIDPIVYYFSGLGRPFAHQGGRLWERSELVQTCVDTTGVSNRRIIGGDAGDDNAMEEEVRAEFDRRLLALQEILSGFHSGFPGVWNALSHMRDRACTNPVDRIAGLLYLLGGVERNTSLLCDAVHRGCMDSIVRRSGGVGIGPLCSLHIPDPGTETKFGDHHGARSWITSRFLPSNFDSLEAWVERTEDTDSDWAEAVSIESGYVQGLSEGSHEGTRRQGELIVTDDAGIQHTISITADHQYQISNGLYALLGSSPYFNRRLFDQYWVVGRRLPEQKFEKVSVFQIADKEEVKRTGWPEDYYRGEILSFLSRAYLCDHFD